MRLARKYVSGAMETVRPGTPTFAFVGSPFFKLLMSWFLCMTPRPNHTISVPRYKGPFNLILADVASGSLRPGWRT